MHELILIGKCWTEYIQALGRGVQCQADLIHHLEPDIIH